MIFLLDFTSEEMASVIDIGPLDLTAFSLKHVQLFDS